MQAFLVALLGAILQETAHWYSIRNRLEVPQYEKLMTSSGYWAVTIIMIAGGSAGTLAWYYDTTPSPTMKEYLVMGAAFPVIFKKVVQAFVSSSPPREAVDQGDSKPNQIRTYFT